MTTRQCITVKLSLARDDFKLDVDLTLPDKGVTVLFGPSGSGKTTLLRAVAGLEKAQGVVTLGDLVWQNSFEGQWLPTWRRQLGYVFQEASLFEHLDVMANLRFGLTRANGPGIKESLELAIDLLGIRTLLGRHPQSLSGGERQRVAIARALATQPRALLLDEPLASLDLSRRQDILPWLEKLSQELHIPMLYVTHSVDELTRLADHVVLLTKGQCSLHGPVNHVLSSLSFAQSSNGESGVVLRGRVSQVDSQYQLSGIKIDETTLWARDQGFAIGTMVRLYVPANNVSLARQEPSTSSIQNTLKVRVDAIETDTHPASCLVRLRHGEHLLLARVTRRAVEQLSLEMNSWVWAQLKSVAVSQTS